MAKHRKKRKSKPTIQKTRKELRKEKRSQKKENKRNFFSKKKLKPEGSSSEKSEFNKTASKQKIAESDGSEIESDFDLSDEEMETKLVETKKESKKKTTPTKSATMPTKSFVDRFHKDQEREKKKQKELERKMRKRRIEQLKIANEEEDKVIRRFEKKLKLDKVKNKNSIHKMFKDDGLGYALELCTEENINKMYLAAKEAADLEDSDDFQEDIKVALGKGTSSQRKKKTKMKLSKIEKKYFRDEFESDLSESDSEIESSESKSSKKKSKNDSLISDSEDSDFDVIPEQDETGENNEKESEGNLTENSDVNDGSDEEIEDALENSKCEESNDENENYEEDEKTSDISEQSETENDKENKESGKEDWEDIYGRKRDKDGNVVEEKCNKYVPPHIRARLEASNKNLDEKQKLKLERLRKQCKGLLNRLSEANMHKIAGQIENIYMTNPRFDVNNSLSELIMEALISNVLAKERMVLEYAMLIAILHANVGNEIGAHFLQELVLKFNNLVQEINSLEVEDKTLDNVVFFISHMFTFKIFHHGLVFEVITKLVSNLCEKSIECLLLILRSIGFQLRKEDPGGLKNFILSIQKKATESSLEIKENPRLKFMLEILNAIKNNNINKIPQYDPSLAEHLKKVLKSMLINGKYVASLNITMEDLLKADEKGKWWVVGSAWTGNIKDIGAANKTNEKNIGHQKFSEKLLELARQQRMNTDDRRNVFCIIMGAEDYIDAFERLLHLSLKDHRVIAAIIIHCCLSEKSYNPYYSVLAQKFCEYDRKYQLAVQFASWDKIKEIQSLNKWQISNLSKFLLHLLVNGGLPLSALKVIEFGELDKATLKLVRQVMLGILLGKEEDCIKVFERIAPSVKLNMFKDSIRLFMHHFLLKDCNKSQTPEEQKILLKDRITLADNIFSYVDSKLRF